MLKSKTIEFICLLLTTCFLGCSQNTKKSDINFTLVDSTNQSSNLVSVQLLNIQNKTFACAAGETKTMEVYAINAQEKFNLLEQHQVTNKSGGLRALTKIQVKDSSFLALGNKADNSLEIYSIKNNGKLKKINAVYDTDTTYIDETVTMHTLIIKDKTFIYAGGLDKGLSCFEITDNGSLRHVQSITDNESLFLHGIIGMTSLVIENKTFLITGAFFDGGISCFQVMENGHLKNVSNVKDDNNLFLNGTFPVNSVQLGNENFLIVGHRHKVHYKGQNAEVDYHGDGVNVFKMNAQGQITLQSLLKDDEKLRLKGSTRIEIIKLDENNAFVFIGTRDDKGIQVCSLQKEGILKPIKSIDLGYPIYNGMTIKKNGDNWYLLAGAYDKNIVELYSLSLD